MGKVASEYTKQRLEGKFIELEFEGDFRDRFNRLLAYVFLDGNNFNIELAQQGLSPYYTQYGHSQKYDSQFKEAEKYARDNKLGLWGDPELTEKYLRLKSKWGQSAKKINQTTKPESGFISHGNVRSKVFHRPGCKDYDCKNCTEMFMRRDAAIAAVYRPCGICKP